MKKSLLLISLLILSLTTWAAQLNPFAYDLSSKLSDDQKTLLVSYRLNAPATGITITVFCDGEQYYTHTYTGNAKNYDDARIHTLEVPMTDFPGGLCTWEITVTGEKVLKPTQVGNGYSFYSPQGLAIDKDPDSEYFGRILMTEARQAVPSSGYTSSGKGAGIYVFSPNFTTDGVVHQGGLNFVRVLQPYSNNHNGGYQPWRVKISDDGRIFVSSLDKRGDKVIVWEVSKDLSTWNPVIQGTNDYDANYQLLNTDKTFYAGLNCSMDVIGSGEDLKLLLYSTSKSGVESFDQSGYRLDEYALGTSTTFTGSPTNIINGGQYGVVHTEVDFIYDGEGGYWFGGSRGGTEGQPNLAHINSEGEEDFNDYSSALYGGGGILIHNGMLFKGIARSSETNGKFRIYTLGKDVEGKPTLEMKWDVVSTGLGRNHNAFAVDYAENLYVVGNSNEKILAFALPYSGSITTPAPSQYSYELGKKLNPYAYDLHTTIDNNGAIQLHYTLNADAKRVQVILMDANKEYTFRDYNGEIV